MISPVVPIEYKKNTCHVERGVGDGMENSGTQPSQIKPEWSAMASDEFRRKKEIVGARPYNRKVISATSAQKSTKLTIITVTSAAINLLYLAKAQAAIILQD